MTTTTTTLGPVLLQRNYQTHGITAGYVIALVCLFAVLAFLAGYLAGRIRGYSA